MEDDILNEKEIFDLLNAEVDFGDWDESENIGIGKMDMSNMMPTVPSIHGSSAFNLTNTVNATTQATLKTVGSSTSLTFAAAATLLVDGSSKAGSVDSDTDSNNKAIPLHELRRDMWRKYPNFFCTMMNSSDANMARAFLQKFCIPSVTLCYSCPNGNKELFAPTFKLSGAGVVLQWFAGNFQQFPDSSCTLTEVMIKPGDGPDGRCQIICSAKCSGTKTVQLTVDEWLPDMRAVADISAAGVEKNMSTAVRKYTKRLRLRQSKSSSGSFSSRDQQSGVESNSVTCADAGSISITGDGSVAATSTIASTDAVHSTRSGDVNRSSDCDQESNQQRKRKISDAIATALSDSFSSYNQPRMAEPRQSRAITTLSSTARHSAASESTISITVAAASSDGSGNAADVDDIHRLDGYSSDAVAAVQYPPLKCTQKLLAAPVPHSLTTTITFLLNGNYCIESIEFYTIVL